MKNLILFASVLVAASFAACSGSKTEAAAEATVEAIDSAACCAVDSAAAACDSAVCCADSVVAAVADSAVATL